MVVWRVASVERRSASNAGSARGAATNRGLKLIGTKADGKDGEPKPKDFKGTAIYAKGVSNVTLVDINAKGWETGLHIESGGEDVIELRP